MPGWSDVTNEIRAVGSGYDVVRRAHIAKLAAKTGRNVIVYYSGFLQKGPLLPQAGGLMSISDIDKNGFMATCQHLDRAKGLDLVLHTPGGDANATESIVDYLQSLFGRDIRAIVPQLAMSAGTLIACACKSIVMGKHSSIGPIDPQVGGVAAHGVLEEFLKARTDIVANPALANLWAPIIAKYSPTLIGACQKSVQLVETLAQNYLVGNMFFGDPDATQKATAVVNEIANHARQLSHARHISLQQASDLGLRVERIEDDAELQDLVLSVHHSCMITLQETAAVKIIENQDGKSFVMIVQVGAPNPSPTFVAIPPAPPQPQAPPPPQPPASPLPPAPPQPQAPTTPPQQPQPTKTARKKPQPKKTSTKRKK